MTEILNSETEMIIYVPTPWSPGPSDLLS